MKTSILLLSFIQGLLFFSSCAFNSAPCKDSTVVSSVRNVANFDGIDLGTSADIKLTQGSPQKIILHGAACDLERVTTELSGSTLKIKNKDRFFGNSRKITAEIVAENINSLSIGGSGNITTENQLSTNSLKISIAGSGSVNIPELNAKEVNSSIAGSGSIHISGKNQIEKQNIEIAGSGDVFAENIPSSEASVRISGSGSCRLHVVNNLNARIAGSGDVFYRGRPSINSSVAGSGKLKSL